MSEIALFENDEFRLEFEQDGNGGFRVDAATVARQLGFREPHDLLRNIPAGERRSETARTPNGGQRHYLTEPGLYRALGQRQASRIADKTAREFVQRFQDWVFGEVLPKLRRGELVPAPRQQAELTEREKLVALAQGVLDAEKRAAVAEEERGIAVAALESAAPAIEYHEKYVAPDDLCTVKSWATQFGLSEPKARDLLAAKGILYRFHIGRRWSEDRGKLVDEFEWRAYAGKPTTPWFALQPQHNAPRHHNNQVRQTLYVRQQYAIELGRKCGLAPVGVQGELIPGGDER